MSMLVEVWGDYACFTRPEMKTERVSYDVMTPSAARGLVEAIYWHPGMKYHIDRIYVLNPIRFTTIRRNEVKSTLLASAALSAVKGGPPPVLYTQEDIQQRAALLLQDVHYVIECHFTMTGTAAGSSRPISGNGPEAPFPPSRSTRTWALCCTIWIIPTRKICGRSSSVPSWKTACWTAGMRRCSHDSASAHRALRAASETR